MQTCFLYITVRSSEVVLEVMTFTSGVEKMKTRPAAWNARSSDATIVQKKQSSRKQNDLGVVLKIAG